MLTIRMQRTGRKGHAMFRIVVQDAARTPTSGKIVALLGSYDPHAKVATFDKEKASFYLKHGAQPSDRAARLLHAEGVKLPTWAKFGANKKRDIRNPEKLRKNQKEALPAEAATEEAPANQADNSPAEDTATSKE